MAKVLLVEDDPDVAFSVAACLQLEQHVVESVTDGKEALDRLRFYQYDLVILDWGLPGMSGLEVCKEFRSRGGKTPILMLTGKAETREKVTGLDSGADDYVTKPFDVDEIIARVRALLRRPEDITGNVLTVGNLTLDTATGHVTRDGMAIKLLPKEFALLSFLMRHVDQVFTGEALLDRVWSSESDATSDALRSTIKRLRKKIDVEGRPSLLQTIPGFGYKLTRNPGP